ncbi:ATP-binding protein [Haloterrigena sp. SYSU A121-1]|uniref:ATP-binding protein n=1 Tax=Haloterrigena gelatinilytica TaxID=2741724 RepID=A0A8J8GL32_9EURY|nr:DUF87 domain-containing protein [Haloterrigena gelatinilytica]NUB91185.1 ATP-binding protein [Haloterrigena gelatinilytica]
MAWIGDDEDTPSREELAELQEMLELVGLSAEKIKQILSMAAMDRDAYGSFVEMYRPQVEEIESRDTYYDWDYPFESYDGDFRIGTNPEGQPVGLTREQLNEHMLIVGRTGAGKTTLFYNLMDECAGMDLPFLVFDFKNDYRHLAEHRDLLVVNWRDLKFNPLQPPPGVRTARWAEVMADTWTHAMGLWKASRGYFIRKLRELYRFYDTEAGEWPSLFELLELVRADEIPYASPRYRYKERLDNRLTGMTGFSGEVFDCSQSYPFEEFLDRNVVVELQEPIEDVQVFVVEALLTWIFYYRVAQGHRQGLRHVVLFDEAKHVFDVNRERDSDSPNPPISTLMGQVREFGEALIVADHEPSKLSDSLKANTNAKLWMSLGSGKDTDEMAQTFGLDAEETEYTRTFEKGEALLKLADRDPVPVALPDYQLEKSMTETEIRERMRSELDSLDWAERMQPSLFQSEVGEDSSGDEPTEQDENAGDGDDDEPDAVAEALLVSIVEEPFLSVSERYDMVGVGSKKGTAAKEELVALDLVSEETVRNGKRGKNPTLLELTEKGHTVLEDRGYDVPGTGRRGIEHRYWQHQIKEFYESDGFDVEIEHAVGSESIDVYVERGVVSIAVEVARSAWHEVENIRKCLDYEVNRVEVVYLEDSVRDQIRSAVEDEFGGVPDLVEFVPVSEYV